MWLIRWAFFVRIIITFVSRIITGLGKLFSIPNKKLALKPQNALSFSLFGFNMSEYITLITTNSTSFNTHFPISNGL